MNDVGGLEILIGFRKGAPFCESEKKMFNETNNRPLLAKVLLVIASQVGQKKERKKVTRVEFSHLRWSVSFC